MIRTWQFAHATQMIPSDIKFDGNATPPQFTDNADQVIERGTHIRVKIKGIRGEVGQMYAIATIKEDYLGYALPREALDHKTILIADNVDPCSRHELDATNDTEDESTNEKQIAIKARRNWAPWDRAFAWRCEEQKLQRKARPSIGKYPIHYKLGTYSDVNHMYTTEVSELLCRIV